MLIRNLRSDLIELNKDRIDEIKVYPLSYAEFYSCYQGAKTEAFSNYYKYGGMPKVARLPEVRFKKNYLKIFVENYINTLIEHKRILKDPSIIDDLLDMDFFLSIGTLAKPLSLLVFLVRRQISRYLRILSAIIWSIL